MLPHPVLRLVASCLPEHVSGLVLHHRALALAEQGSREAAERMFEAAVNLYRREGEVEALARLRVHQLMVRATRSGGVDPEALPEIVRRVGPLDRLESLVAPFALEDARTVLAAWLEAGEAATHHGGAHDADVEGLARVA